MMLSVLDLDMTLADTLKAFHRVYSTILSERGCRPLGWNEFLQGFCSDSLSNHICGDPDDFWREFKQRYLPSRDEVKPYPGARRSLKWLKDRGFRIVVLTGRGLSEDLVWRELGWIGLEEFVDEVYTLRNGGDDLSPFGKSIVLEKLRVEGTNVFVGDYWLDMLSARRAGFKTVGVSSGCKPRWMLALAGAEVVIDTIGLLPEVLEALLPLDPY